jgi:hypothetical protein
MLRYLMSFFKQKKENQITLLRRAMSKQRSEYDLLSKSFDHTNHCCLTCASGGYDLILSRKLNRQAMWLRVLLRRRGTEKDLRDIRNLEFEFGKKNLDDLEKTGGR